MKVEHDLIHDRAVPKSDSLESTTDHAQVPHASLSCLWLALSVTDLCLLPHTLVSINDGPALIRGGSGAGAVQKVWRANQAAEAIGIRQGMSVSAAHALAAGELRVFEREQALEKKYLDKLAVFTLRYSSQVSLLAPETVLIEILGSLKLFGGLKSFLKAFQSGLDARLGQRGVRYAFAVAPNPRAAYCLAQTKPGCLVLDPARLASALSQVPVSCLELSKREQEDLNRIGVRYLGQCRRLPRGGFSKRFSPSLMRQLDQIFGRSPDPREAVSLPAHFREDLDLPSEGFDQGLLVEGAALLLTELADYLSARCAVTSRLSWSLQTKQQALLTFDLVVAEPGCPNGSTHAEWVSLFSHHLERLQRDGHIDIQLKSKIEGMCLTVDEIRPNESQPKSLFSFVAEDDESIRYDWKITLDRLASRLGEESVKFLAVELDHRPERSWRYQSRHVARAHNKVSSEATVLLSKVPRPTWLVPKPQLLQTTPDGRPVWGGPLTLLTMRERIESGWWQGEDCTRDYYWAINRYGQRCWVFRLLRRQPQASRWYLHGLEG